MPENCALLIVDVQTGFVNDNTRHIVPSVEALQSRYDHVYATRFINAEDSPYRKWINWHRLGADSPEIELAFSAHPDTVVYDKHAYSSVDEQFLAELRRHDIEEVHICGIDTDVCVTQSAVDLFEAGVRPVVLAASCASHGGPEFHEYALRILRRLIGEAQIDDPQ